MVFQSGKLDPLTAKVTELLARDSAHQCEVDSRRRVGAIGLFKLDEGSLRDTRCVSAVLSAACISGQYRATRDPPTSTVSVYSIWVYFRLPNGKEIS